MLVVLFLIIGVTEGSFALWQSGSGVQKKITPACLPVTAIESLILGPSPTSSLGDFFMGPEVDVIFIAKPLQNRLLCKKITIP